MKKSKFFPIYKYRNFPILLFLFHCSIPFPEAPVFELLLLGDGLSTQNRSSASTDSNDTNGSDTTVPNEVDNKKYIFATQGNFTGDLGGISGADGNCSTEKNDNFSSLAGAGTDYKALLVSGTTRRACSTVNCGGGIGENIDWVLGANTEYFRSDGVSLFTTNASGIFVFGTMNNPFSSEASDRWWTGLDDDWIGSALGNCDSWASNSNLETGNVGGGNASGKTSLINEFGGDRDCNLTSKLLCVRQ